MTLVSPPNQIQTILECLNRQHPNSQYLMLDLIGLLVVFSENTNLFFTFTDLHSLPKICKIKRAAMRKSWYSLLPITFDKTLNITCVWISLEWNRVSQKSQLIFWNNLLWNWQIISVDFTFIFHIHKSISAIIHYMSVDSIDKHLN